MNAKLRYGFSLSEGPQVGLTYLNADQAGTITVIVSNSGDPVTLQSLSFSMAVGDQNTDLASAAGDIVATYPTGWSDDGNFSYSAPAGLIVDGTTQLQFSFALKVNPLPGSTTIGIREVTDSGSAFMNPPYVLLKTPNTFTLANLSATPNEVTRGTPVTLTWSATPGQLYNIGYPDGPTPFVPTSALAAWLSPPIETSQQNYTFTVSASIQVDGRTVTLQLPVVVQVDNPQIVEFDQPTAPFMTPPVALHWKTSNTDHCQLFSNGVLVDGNAPANPGTAGYPVKPTVVETPYKLIAVKGNASSPSQEVDVLYAQWTEAAPIPFSGSQTSIAMSPSGSLLYVNTGSNLYSLDSVSFHQVATSRIYTGALALQTVVTTDGAWIYAYVLDTSSPDSMTVLYRYQGPGLAQQTPQYPLITAFAVHGGSDPMTYVIGTFFIVASRDYFHAGHEFQFADRVESHGAVLNTDATLVYFMRGDAPGIALWRYDIAGNKAEQVLTGMGGMGGVTPWITPDGTTLYAAAPEDHALLPVALPECTAGNPIIIDSAGVITRIVANSAGTVLFVGVAYATGGAVYYVELATHAVRKIATSQSNVIDIACRPDGSTLFLADGSNVRVINCNVAPTLHSALHTSAPGKN